MYTGETTWIKWQQRTTTLDETFDHRINIIYSLSIVNKINRESNQCSCRDACLLITSWSDTHRFYERRHEFQNRLPVRKSASSIWPLSLLLLLEILPNKTHRYNILFDGRITIHILRGLLKLDFLNLEITEIMPEKFVKWLKDHISPVSGDPSSSLNERNLWISL